MFWFYEGRNITYEEAVELHEYDIYEAPKYHAKKDMKVPDDF
jgi:hypothetical protein